MSQDPKKQQVESNLNILSMLDDRSGQNPKPSQEISSQQKAELSGDFGKDSSRSGTRLLQKVQSPDQSNSLFIGDLDLSKYDPKKQAEIATLMEDKEKQILEKSSLHKEALDNLDTLKKDILSKETEVERLKMLLTDQKSEITDYREKMRNQHDEVLGRLRASEEVVKDMSNYIASQTKLIIGLYNLQLKNLLEVTTPKQSKQNLADSVDLYLKEVEKCFRPLGEKQTKGLKRLQASLDETKSNNSAVFDKIQPKQLNEAYLSSSNTLEQLRANNNLLKTDLEKLNTEHQKLKSKMPAQTSDDQNKQSGSQLDRKNFVDLKELRSLLDKFDTKSLVRPILAKFLDNLSNINCLDTSATPNEIEISVYGMLVDTITVATEFMELKGLTNPLDKTQNLKDALAEQQTKKPLKLGKVSQKIQGFRETQETSIQNENTTLQYDLSHFLEENTGIDEQLQDVLKANHELKDRIATARKHTEYQNSRIKSLKAEKEDLEKQHSSLTGQIKDYEKMVQEESNGFSKLKEKVFTVKDKVREQEDELLRIHQRKKEFEQTLKEAEERERKNKKKLDLARRENRMEIFETPEIFEKAAEIASPIPKDFLVETPAPPFETDKKQAPAKAPGQSPTSPGVNLQASEQKDQKRPGESNKSSTSKYAAGVENRKGSLEELLIPLGGQQQGASEQLPAIPVTLPKTTPEAQEFLNALSVRFTALCNAISQLGQVGSISSIISNELNIINQILSKTFDCIQNTKQRNEKLSFEYTKRNEQSTILKKEEDLHKDKLITLQIKIEEETNRIVASNLEIARYVSKIEQTQREYDSKKLEMLSKQATLGKKKINFGEKMTELKRLDDELAVLRKAEYYQVDGADDEQNGFRAAKDRYGASGGGIATSRFFTLENPFDRNSRTSSHDVGYLKLCLAATIPLVVGYLLFKLGIL